MIFCVNIADEECVNVNLGSLGGKIETILVHEAISRLTLLSNKHLHKEAHKGYV